MSDSEELAPHALHYIPPPPLHRRRNFARWIVLLTLALAVLPAWRWGPQLRQRALLLRNQWACLHFVAPNGTVAAKLSAAKSKPREQASLTQSTTSPPWMAFYNQVAPPGLKSDGTAFVHERTSPGGHQRLVAVDLIIAPGHFSSYDLYPTNLGFATKLFDVGLFHPPKELRAGNYLYCTAPSDVSVTIYYGQADPNDSSHFTIQMTAGEVTRSIDGWLLDDDRVVLELRDGDTPTPPATQLPALSP